MVKGTQSGALEGRLTQVENNYWSLGVADPQVQNPWLALHVFEVGKLAAQITRATNRQTTATKHAVSGYVFVEGPTDGGALLRFLRTNYGSYQGRPINWQHEASPPKMTVCPTY